MSETINNAVILQIGASEAAIISMANSLQSSGYPLALGPIGPDLMKAKLDDLKGALSAFYVRLTTKEAEAMCIALRHLARGPLQFPTTPLLYQRAVESMLKTRPLSEWQAKGVEFLDSLSKDKELMQ